jgi:hypothetical protein
LIFFPLGGVEGNLVIHYGRVTCRMNLKTSSYAPL